jgi:hypothetical protein
MAKNDIYIVKRPFITHGRQVVRRGTRLMGNDPLVKGNEHLMVLATEGFDVEQATARPGEKRNVTPAKESKKADTKSTKAAATDKASEEA